MSRTYGTAMGPVRSCSGQPEEQQMEFGRMLAHFLAIYKPEGYAVAVASVDGDSSPCFVIVMPENIHIFFKLSEIRVMDVEHEVADAPGQH